jgi:hypothetical protein
LLARADRSSTGKATVRQTAVHVPATTCSQTGQASSISDGQYPAGEAKEEASSISDGQTAVHVHSAHLSLYILLYLALILPAAVGSGANSDAMAHLSHLESSRYAMTTFFAFFECVQCSLSPPEKNCLSFQFADLLAKQWNKTVKMSLLWLTLPGSLNAI